MLEASEAAVGKAHRNLSVRNKNAAGIKKILQNNSLEENSQGMHVAQNVLLMCCYCVATVLLGGMHVAQSAKTLYDLSKLARRVREAHILKSALYSTFISLTLYDLSKFS